MRQYSIDDRDKEHTVSLCIENWWTGDREIFIKETPSRYFIEVWEPTDVLLITKKDSMNLIKSIPAQAELSKTIDDQQAFALLDRINANISF